MKKLILIPLFFMVYFLGAQNIGYVDTELIKSKMPQYNEGMTRINNEVKKWQENIETKKSEIDKDLASLENEKVLLTENQYKERQAVIDQKQKVLNDYINGKFGMDGELIKLKQNISKPIQDKIWNAIATVSQTKKIGIMFDKGDNSMVMIYSEPKYDYTDAVMKELGLNKKENK